MAIDVYLNQTASHSNFNDDVNHGIDFLKKSASL